MAEIHVSSINQIIDKDTTINKNKNISSAIQIIRFFIDEFEFALDIMDVKEIKEMDIIRHLPNSLPFVRGLLNLRGDIIPVLDLKKKLELENLTLKDIAKIGEKKESKDKEERDVANTKIDKDVENVSESSNNNDNPSIIICKVGSENFGIVVDKIYRVQYLTTDEYEPTPELFENIGKKFIKGFAKIDKKIIVILSLADLFF